VVHLFGVVLRYSDLLRVSPPAFDGGSHDSASAQYISVAAEQLADTEQLTDSEYNGEYRDGTGRAYALLDRGAQGDKYGEYSMLCVYAYVARELCDGAVEEVNLF
jgi:hypothetical protein